MLLQHSRRAAGVGPAGELVTLEEQDRSRWDRAEIADGLRLLAPERLGAVPVAGGDRGLPRLGQQCRRH